jgi:predicted ATPase
MLTQIKLTNFKCFETETTFPLSQLNLLTGMNGRGKSTLLQSLLLMRQTTERETATAVFLNGNCLNLGSFEEVKNQNASRETPIIFEYCSSPDQRLHYQLGKNPEDDTVLLIVEVTTPLLKFKRTTGDLFRAYDSAEQEVKGLVTFFNLAPKLVSSWEDSPWSKESVFDKIHYLSTGRKIGPQPLDFPSALGKFPQVGVKGEFTANILYNKANHTVPEHLCLDSQSDALAYQTSAWLNQIFEGAPVEVVLVHFQEMRLLDILFKTHHHSSDRVNRPINIGFGYSQALPIIVSGLLAKKGDILIIENPETHLHPQAQSRLLQFLAKVCKGGVQVFIESHSDHMLNAVRVMVKDQLVTPEQLSILYFCQNREQSKVIPIPVLPTGGIEEWPEGFFDQTLKDFEKLFGM